jgi:hypothetical protein
MYLSAERVAIANQVVRETFEQCSVAWQAIPNWDTGDPSQTMVRDDNVNAAAAYLPLESLPKDFDVTLAEAIAPTHDAVLAKVIANTAKLAKLFDDKVISAHRTKKIPKVTGFDVSGAAGTDKVLHEKLIEARAKVENGGYRAPSAVITNTAGLQALSQLISGYSILDSLLGPANINSVYRVDTLETTPPALEKILGYLIGRRQRIAQGGAPDVSPGEEPVDIAVSVPPSLEVLGDISADTIKLRVRISFATRVKDDLGGLVAFLA